MQYRYTPVTFDMFDHLTSPLRRTLVMPRYLAAQRQRMPAGTFRRFRRFGFRRFGFRRFGFGRFGFGRFGFGRFGFGRRSSHLMRRTLLHVNDQSENIVLRYLDTQVLDVAVGPTGRMWWMWWMWWMWRSGGIVGFQS